MPSGHQAGCADMGGCGVGSFHRKLCWKLCYGLLLCALWGGHGIAGSTSGVDDPSAPGSAVEAPGSAVELGLPPLLIVSSRGGHSVSASVQRRGQRPPGAGTRRADDFPQMVFIRMESLAGLLDEYRLRSGQVREQTTPVARGLQERLSRLLAEIDGLPELRDTLGEEEYQTRRQALLAQKHALEQELEQLNQRVLDLGERFLDPVRKRIQSALVEYARERGIEMVVDQRLAFELVGLIYAHPRRDITETFAQYYNARYPVRGVTRRSN